MTPDAAVQLLGQLLADDLRALIVEARKRHPPVKDACEHSLAKLAEISTNRAKLNAPLDVFLRDAEELWKPLVLACDFKAPRLSAISVGAIQKLISRELVPHDSVATIVQCLVKIGSDVDESVQLRVLNCLMTLFSSSSGYDMTAAMMRDVMSLAFSMYLSRNAVVQSTAAATINQITLAQFHRLAASLPPSALNEAMTPPPQASPPHSPPHSATAQDKLSGIAACACLLFKDLCTLLSPPRSPSGHISMHLPTFKIQGETPKLFIMDLLYSIVKDHAAVVHAHPQLLQLVVEDLSTVLLHAMHSATDLPTVVRVHRIATCALQRFPYHLVRQQEAVIASMIRTVESQTAPMWHKVIILTCWRELGENYYYLKKLYTQYDHNPKQNTKLFQDLIRAVCRMIQKLQPQAFSGISMTAERVSFNKFLAIKADEEVLIKQGEGAVWAIDTLVAISKSLSKLVEIECRPLTDSEVANDVEQQQQQTAQHMLAATWREVLAGCSYLLEQCQDEETVEETLRCFKQYCHACGKVGLEAERDCFIQTMNQFTLPVSGSLTSKNVQVLRVLFDVANILGGVLGSSWYILLTNFQHLNTILSNSGNDQGSDLQLLRSLLAEVFGGTRFFEDGALLSMIHALCKLSDEQLGSPVGGRGGGAPLHVDTTNSPVAKGARGGAPPSTFGLQRLAEISVTNIVRLPLFWDVLLGHLAGLVREAADEALRRAIVDTASQVLLAYLKKFRQAQTPSTAGDPTMSPRAGGGGGDPLASSGNSPVSRSPAVSPTSGSGAPPCEDFFAMQHKVVDVLRMLMACGQPDVKVACLNLVFMVMQRAGQELTPASWRTILMLLSASSRDANDVNVGWKSVEYIYFNFLQLLQTAELESLIVCVGHYAKQTALPDKTNMNLSAIQQGLLSIADFCSSHPSDATATHWNSLFIQLRDATTDARPHVRNTAIHTLLTALVTHGNGLPLSCWSTLFWDVLIKVLDTVHSSAMAAEEKGSEQVQAQKGVRVHHSRDTVAKQWYETRRTVLDGVARLVKVFYLTCAKNTVNFTDMLSRVAGHLANACAHTANEVAMVGLRSLQELLVDVSIAADDEAHPLVLWQTAWRAWEAIADGAATAEGTGAPSTQVVQTLTETVAEVYTQRNTSPQGARLTKYLAPYNTLILPLLDKVMRSPAARDAMSFPSKVQINVFKCLAANPVPAGNTKLRTELLHLINSFILPCPVVEQCIREPEQAAVAKLVGPGQTQLTARVLQLIHERYCDPGRREAPEVCKAGFLSTIQAFRSVLLTRYIAHKRFEMFDEIVSTMTDVFTKTLPHYTKADGGDALAVWEAILSLCDVYWRQGESSSVRNTSISGVNSFDTASKEPTSKGEVCDAGVLGMMGLLLPYTVRHDVPDVLRRAVAQLAKCSAQRSQRGTSMTAMQSLFQLCDCRDGDDEALCIGRVAMPIVVSRCSEILNEYLVDDRRTGKLPLPRFRRDEVVAVIEKLANNKFSPVLFEAMPDAADLRIRCPAAFGSRGLAVRMFPVLIEFVATQDEPLKESLAGVMQIIAGELGLTAGVLPPKSGS